MHITQMASVYHRFQLLQVLVDNARQFAAVDVDILLFIIVIREGMGGRRRETWMKTWLLRRAQHRQRRLKELATEAHPGFEIFKRVPTCVFRELLQKRLQTALQRLEMHAIA